MADKNLARSGSADIDLLSDDDPLAELARIVGYEPRNVPTAARPVPPEPLQEPAFDLEGELLREFARYDAPSLDPVADVEADRHVTFGDAAGNAHAGGVAEPVEGAAESTEQTHDFTQLSPPVSDSERHGGYSPSDASVATSAGEWAAAQVFPEVTQSAEVEQPVVAESAPVAAVDIPPLSEPVFLGLQPAEVAPSLEPVALDLDLDLDRELELSLGDAFADMPEARHVEAPAHQVETQYVPNADTSYDAAAAGLPIAATGDAHTGVLQESIVEPVPSIVYREEVSLASPPVYSEPLPVNTEFGEGAHFEAAELPVEIASVDFVPAWMAEPQTDVPMAAVEDALAASVAEATSTFEPEPSYEQAPAARVADGYHLDELLAEVERFPVPETRSPLAAPPETPRTRPGTLDGFSSVKFGRATPVAFNRQQGTVTTPSLAATPAPAAQFEPATVPAALAVEMVSEASWTVAPQTAEPAIESAAAEGEDAFANFELDLSDIELDLDASDLMLEDEPRPVVAPIAPQPAAVAPHVVSGPAVAEFSAPQPLPILSPIQQTRAEPAFVPAEPVAAARAPVPEDLDVVLPFDPSLIAETDTSVAPVAELNVPHLPIPEKEKPAVHQPEYDIDIDAEMAQLFTDPAAVAGYARGTDRSGTVASVAAAAKAGAGAADEFDKALEEDLRRSLSQPERHAIPLDAQIDDEFVGDGYNEPARRGRGMMIAAAAAVAVVLGGAGVYAYLASTGAVGTDASEPRVILADKDPVKIVPEEKGGKTVPNQDKAVYDRVAGATNTATTQEQLVTSTEEPVDVVQRTLAPESLPFDGPEDEAPAMDNGNASANDDRLLPGVDDEAAAEASQQGRAPVVSPRKVRTMIVKPDGTLVAREEPAVEPESALASAESNVEAPTTGNATVDASASASADAGLRAEQTAGAAVAADENARAIQDAANASVADSAPVRVVRTTTVGSPADATAQVAADQASGTAPNGAPVPVTRPAEQPVDVVGTVTERGRVADAKPTETAALAADQTQQAAAEQAPAATANPGGYVIQIASLPSEEEANKSYKSLSAKFSGMIGGRGVDIKRADIPNKGTYYRVRIPAGSKEEANALCAKYKSAGGSCLVTK
ncbi:SPOR domain-containing protein [Rhizobium sp. ARZ01]|uniref:SPOR domain-containing protein n=1 Tax=Rhizobium sp. ARZ01 TaxID=2769313 RepID=UPI00177BFFA7|nr:SPOR domain-containing protein [Rhizobium sp. ARZ01]MBD9372150.1 SPOR domain-containing protein [Rhizobium sp. ARZ01]